MFRATSKITRGDSAPPSALKIIDVGKHPDAPLLRLCVNLVRLRDAQDRLESAIAGAEAELRRTPAVTEDGRRLRELAL